MRAASCRVLLAFLALLCASSARASDFDAANELYDAGKYAEAKAAYDSMVARSEWTANLFYNLGNAEFRLDESGAASLAYTRALALEPSHPEARANLQVVRTKTGAVPWPLSWLDAIFPGRWISAYVILAAVAAWVAVALLASIGFTPRGDKTGRWFAFSLALLVGIYASVAVWHFESARSLAIVVAKTAEVRLAPAETSATAGALPAGSEVRVLSVRGAWTYCALPEQRRGWIISTALERVRLGES